MHAALVNVKGRVFVLGGAQRSVEFHVFGVAQNRWHSITKEDEVGIPSFELTGSSLGPRGSAHAMVHCYNKLIVFGGDFPSQASLSRTSSARMRKVKGRNDPCRYLLYLLQD